MGRPDGLPTKDAPEVVDPVIAIQISSHKRCRIHKKSNLEPSDLVTTAVLSEVIL